MWINSKQREEPYLGLTCTDALGESRVSCLRVKRTQVLHGCRQLVLWSVGLSPLTSETLVASCQRVMPGTLARLPALSRRKVGTTSSHHGLYAQGFTRATMGRTERRETVRWSKSQKTFLSSDWGLQFDPMKLESLVIAYQQRRGEYVPEPCTHRPSSHGSWEFPKSQRFVCADGKPGDWD